MSLLYIKIKYSLKCFNQAYSHFFFNSLLALTDEYLETGANEIKEIENQPNAKKFKPDNNSFLT